MKYRVRRRVDSFVVFETDIEADSEAEAVGVAQQAEDEFEWSVQGVEFFDAREFVAIDHEGTEVGETRTGDF